MKKGRLDRKKNYGWVFVAPFLFGLVTLYIPVLYDSVLYSFSTISMTPTGAAFDPVGWGNYHKALLEDATFLPTLVESVSSILLDTPIILLYSLTIAVLLNTKMRGRGVFRVIFFIPVILATGIIEKADLTNSMLTSLSGTAALDTGGTGTSLIDAIDIANYLQNLNISPAISDYVISMASNIYDIIKNSGVQILIFLAGLQAISPSIYEAAYIEGAGAWESFWKLTFPMLGPIIIANAVYSLIESFTRPANPMMVYLDEIGVVKPQFGYSQSVAVLYTVVVIVMLALVAAVVFGIYRLAQRGRRNGL